MQPTTKKIRATAKVALNTKIKEENFEWIEVNVLWQKF